MHVAIIDYGTSNLGSVHRAFEECGATVRTVSDPSQLGEVDRIVLPGVGAFADGMAGLRARGWPEKLRVTLANPEVQLLGICLGMQLLATKGYENGETAGLCLIPGEVVRLDPGTQAVRIPHVGWNEVQVARPLPLLSGISDGTDFYFVHSYHFRPDSEAHVGATTPYCGSFASVIASANIVATQFHPEKSSRAGFRLIRNFLAR